MDWGGKGEEEDEKKEQLKAPHLFLKSGTKRMELTAVHNHLRFRHGGSCWEQIKPLKNQLRMSGV